MLTWFKKMSNARWKSSAMQLDQGVPVVSVHSPDTAPSAPSRAIPSLMSALMSACAHAGSATTSKPEVGNDPLSHAEGVTASSHRRRAEPDILRKPTRWYEAVQLELSWSVFKLRAQQVEAPEVVFDRQHGAAREASLVSVAA